VAAGTSAALEDAVATQTSLPPDWQPSDEDWKYAADQGLTGEDIKQSLDDPQPTLTLTPSAIQWR
jgi:hypothetical protein